MKLAQQVLILLLCCSLVRFTAQAESLGPTGQSNEQSSVPSAQQSPQELQQLIAPIALYPDALVAQILAASTYPTEIVEADRWMQGHSKLKGEDLAKKSTNSPGTRALRLSLNSRRFLKTWTRTSLGLPHLATHTPTNSRM